MTKWIAVCQAETSLKRIAITVYSGVARSRGLLSRLHLSRCCFELRAAEGRRGDTIFTPLKLTFPISAEDFWSLQAPFVVRPGRNPGFRGAMIFCLLLAGIGSYCTIQGMGFLVGGSLFGLSAASGALAYFLEKRSVRASGAKYKNAIAAAFQNLHCRDERSFETADNGFTSTCRCGMVTRPWQELLRFTETKRVFVLGTRTDTQIIPKSAFGSEGEVTEFRALLSEKLNSDKPLTSRPIDFAYTKQDFRHAHRVNILRAGRWRKLSWALIVYFSFAFLCFVIWKSLSPHHDEAILAAVVAIFLAVPLMQAAKFRRKHYFGPLRLYFGAEGIHVQYPATISRVPWKQFIGYVEDKRVILLYQNPRAYSLIPKRVLGEREAEFRGLVERNLRPYDFRMPAANVLPQESRSPAQQ